MDFAVEFNIFFRVGYAQTIYFFRIFPRKLGIWLYLDSSLTPVAQYSQKTCLQ